MKLVNVKSFLFLFLSFTLSLFAQTPDDLPKKPPNDRLVYDYGNVMSAQERSQLENKLVAYNDSTSTQIAVITLKSLNGYPIEALANDIGEKWGVGEKGKDNGIVLLMSKEDRKVTLRGGYGMQVKMPPTIEKLIIDNDIIPWFKEEKYYNGLNAGVDAIFEVLSGQYQANPKDSPQDNILGTVILVIALVFLVSLFFGGGSGNNSSGGSRGRRRGFFDDVIITNSGRGAWGGGGFGGSSGGGFGGFGGGSFGGGGASGSW